MFSAMLCSGSSNCEVPREITLHMYPGLRNALRSAVSCYPGKTLPFLTRRLLGKRMPKGLAAERLGMLCGHYEPAVEAVFAEVLNRTSVAYDIGANVGYTSLLMASYAIEGKVFAFEPLPANLEILRSMVECNNVEGIIIPVAAAISNVKGRSELQLWQDTSTAFLQSARDSQQCDDLPTLDVSTNTIDNLVLTEGFPPPDLLKIDVEGAEPLVIEGSRETILRYRPILLIELHGPTKAAQTWDAMRSLPLEWYEVNKMNRSVIDSKNRLLSMFSKENWTVHVLCRSPKA